MGVENHRLEMLFLSPAERGKGLGLEKLPLDKDISFSIPEPRLFSMSF